MAKRQGSSSRSTAAPSSSTAAPEASAAGASTLEQSVVAFAEQLGRIAGTVQSRTEGWLDRDTLNRQLASIREGADDLLRRLGGRAAAGTQEKRAPAARKARSGGVVDAPGKKHRKPAPSDPRAKGAITRAPSGRRQVKADRGRGRG